MLNGRGRSCKDAGEEWGRGPKRIFNADSPRMRRRRKMSVFGIITAEKLVASDLIATQVEIATVARFLV
ncbi:hypothetical protein BH20ACI2_BH20ACI2_06050 [soil metagenome]